MTTFNKIEQGIDTALEVYGIYSQKMLPFETRKVYLSINRVLVKLILSNLNGAVAIARFNLHATNQPLNGAMIYQAGKRVRWE